MTTTDDYAGTALTAAAAAGAYNTPSGAEYFTAILLASSITKSLANLSYITICAMVRT